MIFLRDSRMLLLKNFVALSGNFFPYIINKKSHDFSLAICNKRALVKVSKTTDSSRPAGWCNFASP